MHSTWPQQSHTDDTASPHLPHRSNSRVSQPHLLHSSAFKMVTWEKGFRYRHRRLCDRTERTGMASHRYR